MPFVILLPVDGSSHSLNAVRHAVAILERSPADSVLHLMHVQYRIPPRPAAVVGREVVEAYYRSETEKSVRAAKRLLDGRNAPHQQVRRIGYPAIEIVRYAKTKKVDLVVMGSHGHGAGKSLLLGSVAQGVLADCSAAVLVVRDGATPSRNGEVLIAADGSAFSQRALAYFLKHRPQLAPEAPITLLHVSIPMGNRFFTLPKSEQRNFVDAERDRAMRSARRLLTRAHVPWHEARAKGNAGVEIAAYARRNKPGLIVMGSHGHGAISGLLLGSVTQKTIALCQSPLLIVK